MSHYLEPQAISDAVAAAIARAIEQSGHSVQEVADRAGMPDYDLLNKLAARESFNIVDLAHIAEALDIQSPTALIAEALGGDRK